ncbi:MAG: hypothetical protein ACI82S_003167, partial [Patiriisocius sp.]
MHPTFATEHACCVYAISAFTLAQRAFFNRHK